MTPILITGCKGQLGSEIQRISTEFTEMSFFFTDLDELDITRPDDISAYLDHNPVSFIINCAGYTAVDKAEDDKEMAFLINAEATQSIAAISSNREIQLIHLSTDYVFDGEKNYPYMENDPVNPQSVYGESKLKGELALFQLNKGIIIRTSWLYSAFGHNFVKTILRLAIEKDQLNVVFDQTGCPTYARDLAVAILQMIRTEIKLENTPRYDVYHISNQGMCSWYEFASSIIELAGIDCKILPVESKDYVTRATRPRNSVMNKEKILADYGILLPHWGDSLRVCIEELTAK